MGRHSARASRCSTDARSRKALSAFEHVHETARYVCGSLAGSKRSDCRAGWRGTAENRDRPQRLRQGNPTRRDPLPEPRLVPRRRGPAARPEADGCRPRRGGVSLSDFLATVVRVLEDADVPFMRTGSLAAAFYGPPRATPGRRRHNRCGSEAPGPADRRAAGSRILREIATSNEMRNLSVKFGDRRQPRSSALAPQRGPAPPTVPALSSKGRYIVRHLHLPRIWAPDPGR
jgi:hypothetical protein